MKGGRARCDRRSGRRPSTARVWARSPPPPLPGRPLPSPRLRSPPGQRELRGCRLARDAMYRLLSAVTARATTPRGWAWGSGRRGAHQRAGLPPLGPGWVGGLGLGLGLALGVKLAGGLRGAAPSPLPAAPDPEASPQTEPLPPQELSLAPWSPQTPAPPHSRRFARAIESSRDLLHRIKVRRQGAWAAGQPAAHPRRHLGVGPLDGRFLGPSGPQPGGGMPAVGFWETLPISWPHSHGQTFLGGCPSRGGGHRPPRGPPLPPPCADSVHPSPIAPGRPEARWAGPGRGGGAERRGRARAEGRGRAEGAGSGGSGGNRWRRGGGVGLSLNCQLFLLRS